MAALSQLSYSPEAIILGHSNACALVISTGIQAETDTARAAAAQRGSNFTQAASIDSAP